MNQPARNYHHGNLRDALILAAATMIENQGSLEFSITDAARQAGVSVAAPYRHFKDKEDLLCSVRDLAFIGLQEAAERTMLESKVSVGSVGMIIEMGHCYLAYAREKRAFFSLMWEDRGDSDERRSMLSKQHTGFDVLAETVARYCDEHAPATLLRPMTREDPLTLSVATQLWAMAHGIATLEHNHMLDFFSRAATPERLLEDSTRALLSGLQLDKPRKIERATVQDNPQQQLHL